jgi:Holliday junction resolvase RusA-like endonuclease
MTGLLVLDLSVNPIPLARARVYQPDVNERFSQEFRWALKVAGVRKPMLGPLRVGLRLWRRCRGSARGDVGSLGQAVIDAGNRMLWEDEEQIVDLWVRLEDWGPKAQARILIEVASLAELAG